MRIFCDTNIVIEMIEDRKQAEFVQSILSANHHFYLSSGSFYTITYLVERFLKRQSIYAEQKQLMLKSILGGLLEVFDIVGVSKERFVMTIDDGTFEDLEDGYQYQAALQCKADVLLTINKKDFDNLTSDVITILTPIEFMETYA